MGTSARKDGVMAESLSAAEVEGILGVLRRYEALWQYDYGKDDANLVGDQKRVFVGDLAAIQRQIIGLIGSIPGMGEDMKASLAEISKEIKSLANWQFFLDGGKSVAEFNAFGDMVLEKVQRMINEVE